MPSYMKFMIKPNLEYLAKIVQGLMECHPDEPSSEIVEYVSKWPGVNG